MCNMALKLPLAIYHFKCCLPLVIIVLFVRGNMLFLFTFTWCHLDFSVTAKKNECFLSSLLCEEVGKLRVNVKFSCLHGLTYVLNSFRHTFLIILKSFSFVLGMFPFWKSFWHFVCLKRSCHATFSYN